MNRPQADEFGAYYKNYISAVGENVESELEEQLVEFPRFLRSLRDKADYAYAPGKWTIKELLGHITDTERIMAYRLLRVARKDTTPLPGFDQDDYVKYASHGTADFEKLVAEFEAVRRSTLFLVQSLTDEQLNYRGTASANPVSARALVFILAGHLKHHERMIREKYLNAEK